MNAGMLKSQPINSLEIQLGLYHPSALECFLHNPTRENFAQIPKSNQLPEQIQLAVKTDGLALKYASKRVISYKICETAVMQDGRALFFVPEKYITPELCELAVQNTGLALHCVPVKWITPELAMLAVSKPIDLFRSFRDFRLLDYPLASIPIDLITHELLIKSVSVNPYSLRNVPKRFINAELIRMAVSKNGLALQYAPKNRISNQIVQLALGNNPHALQYVPTSRLTKEICLEIFNRDITVFPLIPHDYISHDMCIAYIQKLQDPNAFRFGSIPDKYKNSKEVLDVIINAYGLTPIIQWIEWEKEHSDKENPTPFPISEENLQYIESMAGISNSDRLLDVSSSDNPLDLSRTITPIFADDSALFENAISMHADSTIGFSSFPEDNDQQILYYITDCHIEFQLASVLEKDNLTDEEFKIALDKKLSEMVQSTSAHGILFIGGDVSARPSLTKLFYERLSEIWHGKIIAVLGNHELWDGHPESANSRPLDEIVNDYRALITRSEYGRNSPILLQNEIYILYKNQNGRVISESQIISASDQDLSDICSKSSMIVLGGVGFSGLNPEYNATKGYYRSLANTLEKDRELTSHFTFIYEKLLRCAGNRKVIVLTHTPYYNWTHIAPNHNWFYINGHTHRNTLQIDQDGTSILADNQIGYHPKKWVLHGFPYTQWYDPLRDYKDGIHIISSVVYADFNRGRGIHCEGCNHSGTLYALKRNNRYMFLLESFSGLCLLAGGKRTKLKNSNVDYYYQNMDTYFHKIKEAIQPYQTAMNKLSNEIRQLGGSGLKHGCIIDITFLSHIYLNPYDGTVTPYWATSIMSRHAYKSLTALLKEKEPELLTRQLAASQEGKTPLLDQYAGEKTKAPKKKKNSLATVPEIVFGTEMYEPSRIMRSMQYIFDHNVIRIWNDDLLLMDLGRLELDKSEMKGIPEK